MGHTLTQECIKTEIMNHYGNVGLQGKCYSMPGSIPPENYIHTDRDSNQWLFLSLVAQFEWSYLESNKGDSCSLYMKGILAPLNSTPSVHTCSTLFPMSP